MTKEELKQHIIDECRELFQKAKEMEYLKTEPKKWNILKLVNQMKMACLQICLKIHIKLRKK